MQILRHLESQLKYIVIETEHLFPSGLHGTKATVQGLQSSIGEMSLTFPVTLVSTLRELVTVSAAMWSIFFLQFLSFLPVVQSSSFLLLGVFPLIFLHYGCVSFPSVACLRLKERFSNYVQTIILDICR